MNLILLTWASTLAGETRASESKLLSPFNNVIMFTIPFEVSLESEKDNGAGEEGEGEEEEGEGEEGEDSSKAMDPFNISSILTFLPAVKSDEINRLQNTKSNHNI